MKIFTLQNLRSSLLIALAFCSMAMSAQITETFNWNMPNRSLIKSKVVNGFIYNSFQFDTQYVPNSLYTENLNGNEMSPSTITLIKPHKKFNLVSINLGSYRSAGTFPEPIRIVGLRDGQIVASYEITVQNHMTAVFFYDRATIEAGTAVVPGSYTNIDQLRFERVDTQYMFAYDDFVYQLVDASASSLKVVSPSFGPAMGGTEVRLFGSHFTGATNVLFGDQAAQSFNVVSDSEIITVSPAGTGDVGILVDVSGAMYAVGDYTYDEPVINSISSAYGCLAGGTHLILQGENLTGIISVNFNGTKTYDFNVSSDNEVALYSPAGTGMVALSVSSASGTSAPHSFEYVDPQVQFVEASSSGLESGVSYDIELELSYPIDHAVSIRCNIDGTATGSGVDYNIVNDVISFDPGEMSATITIDNIVDDLLEEGLETIVLTLSDPSNSSIGANSEHVFTIIDDDLVTAMEEASSNELKVFPNPFVSKVNVNGVKENMSKFSVISSSGSTVLTGAYSGETELNLDDLSADIYLLVFENNAGERQEVKIAK